MKEELIEQKEKLLNKMKGINDWIQDNPEVTEPNMYQMIECVTELGMISRKENIAKRQNKFPEQGSDLAQLYVEWHKMYDARLNRDKVKSPTFSVNKDTKLYDYFMDLNMRCCMGEFRFPGMDIDESKLSEQEKKALENEREEFLLGVKKIGSVSLYINQQKLQNPNFVYDNNEEFELVNQIAEKYEKYMPAYSRDVIEDIDKNRELAKTIPEAPNGEGGFVI